MNLAVIDTRTHEIKVYKGKEKIAENTFSVSLDKEQAEAYRADSAAFLKSLEALVEVKDEAAH